MIVFRACMANTLETAYQLRDAGEFMLASQSIVPIAGIWPWRAGYTVADDKGTGDSLDAAAKEELKAICDAADFGQMSVAAQVDFKHTRGVFRGVLTEAPPKTRGFESIPADSHPLWRSIKAKLDRSKLRVLKEAGRSERVAGQRAHELPALRPAGVPGRSLRGLLLRPRLRAAGPVLRRRGRRRLGQDARWR